MTVDIKINGSALDGTRQIWADDGSVVEEVSGLALGDGVAGVGALQAVTSSLRNPAAASGKTLELTFSDGGTVAGRINSFSDRDGQATLTADSPLAVLNRVVRIGPTTSNLGTMLTAIFSACGLASNKYSINGTIFNRSVTLPGWQGDAWQKLKELSAVERFDILPVGGIITVRPHAATTASIDAHASLGEGVEPGSLGLYVETYLYTYQQISNAVVYPPAQYDDEFGGTRPAGWSPDAQVIEVTPGSPVTIEVPILASLSSVVQPTCVDWVARTQGGSVYTVTTNDGVRAVNPSTWTSRGGKVSVEIMPDTSTLKITVDAGRNDIAGAPYRLMLDDGATEYSTLRIAGTGVAWTRDRLRQRTDTPEALTENEIASSSDSIYVRTEQQAYRMLAAQAAQVGGTATLTTDMATLTPAIGERAGAVVRGRRSNYRLRSVTTGPFAVSMQGDQYTTVGAHDAAFAGKKVIDVNALWAGQTVAAHNATPLPAHAYELVLPSGAVVPGSGRLVIA